MSFIYSPPPTIPPQTEEVVFVVATADNDAAVKAGIPGILAMPYTLQQQLE
jgi:hypothetical protein